MAGLGRSRISVSGQAGRSSEPIAMETPSAAFAAPMVAIEGKGYQPLTLGAGSFRLSQVRIPLPKYMRRVI